MTSSSKQFKPVTDPSHSCFWEWDLQTNQVWRSEQFNQVFGSLTDESGVDAWHDRIHSDDREAVISRLLEVADQGGNWADEYRFRRADGSYAHVYDQGFTVVRHKAVVRMTGYMTDLSAPGLQPEATQVDDTYWKIALESAEMGTWLVDLNTRLLYWNNRCRTFLGYSTGDHIAI
ncbi:MAG TPA: PAS domain-containing protein, partial [Fibrella sp.]